MAQQSQQGEKDLVVFATPSTRRKDLTHVPSRSLPDDYVGPRSPDQAAAWLTAHGFRMSGSTVRKLVESGRIDAIRTSEGKGAWVRIRLSELERYVRDNR